MNKILYKLLCLIVLLSCFSSYAQETSKSSVTQRIIEPEPGDCEEYQKYEWFYDNDGDGAGDPNYSQMACTRPSVKWVGNNNDCNDNNPAITYYVWYYDGDHDGFGTSNAIATGCTQPLNYVDNNLDCNDNNKDINPYTKWYLDNNGDGIGSDLDGSPIIGCTKPAGDYLNQENDNTAHWIHQISYDVKGNITGASRSYFDDLGKSDVSLSKDYVTNKIWGTETTYDDFGRTDKTSFIAPSPLSSFKKTNFLKSNAEVIAGSYPPTLSLTNITASNTYKATQFISVTGTVASGLNLNLVAPTITLNNTFSVTATSGSSFVITAANLQDVSANPSLANYYSDSNTDELYQATATHPFSQSNYDSLNPGNIINVVGGNKINGEWKTGYSYTIPAAQEMYYVYGTDFLNNNPDTEFYLPKKELPQYDNLGLSSYFMRTITSESQVMSVESIPGPGFNIMIQLGAPPYAVKTNFPLQKGKLYKVLIGGETKIVQIFNEINYRNETGNSNININNPVTVLAGSWETYNEVNILNQVNSISNNPNNLITYLKCFKSINVDANGVENVSFTDSEGKTLANARSGGSTQYPVKSLIGPQGYIDIHVPQGCGGTLAFIGNAALYNVYDLKTGNLLSNNEKTNVQSGTYRIELVTKPNYALGLTYINKSNGSINNVLLEDLGVTYNVNYYDYTVNIYNKTQQLIKSIQPNGYVSNSSIVANPTHMASSNFASLYEYDTLGQLIKTSSPDQGTSRFAYRNDGQIRYSQSALQADTNVSYTDYDELGRPKESGVITDSSGVWVSANANPNGALIAGTRSEQVYTIYDYPENNTTSVALPTTPTNLTLAGVLATAGISSTNYIQNNLSGNVAVTYTKPGAAISAITWYSYDLYGRTEWIAQYNEGIGAKTIHYEYDFKGNVKKVLFQKDKTTELFVHQYSYDLNNVLTKVETSTDNITFITHADYSYYKTGELKRVNIAQGAQGLDYVYTLGGQVKSINHPSLEAAKDPGGDSNDVFGLTLDYYNGDYLRTGRNITSSPTIGADYNGNIKGSRWANKGIAGDYSGSSANQKGYLYNYDRNNWLTGATFGNTNSSTAAINPTSSLAEGGLTYDANGNIKTLQRTNESGTIVDNLTYNYTGSNQLNSVTENAPITADVNDIENQAPGNYVYDAIGQLKQNVSENLYYFYNTQGLVTEIKKGTNTLVKLFYNERGQRIKKESYNTTNFTLQNTTFYELDLSGNAMAIYNQSYGESITQNDLPVYGLNRLGIYNRSTTITSYEIKDHLGNVRAVIEKQSGIPVIKSYADYYPFGEQLPSRNSLSNYRYAFQGQEIDQETGMEAFQLRLWDGRLGRWLSTDPYGQYASPYLGMGNNPVSGIDPDGGFWQELGNWVSGNGWHTNSALAYQSNGGKLGEWQGNKFSGYEEGSRTITDSDGIGIEVKRFNAVDDLWDNSARRYLTGDKIAFGVSWDASLFGGGGSAIELNWILTGKDKSFFPYVGGNGHVVVGTGAGIFADFTASKSWHSGPSQAVSAKSLPGWEHGVEVSGHVIGGGSIGYSYSEDGKYGWHTVTVAAGPGLDASPLTAVNIKYVASYNFLQLHTGTGKWYDNK